eukprot:33920-Eustigmatos_ZCMA.PRE.1
MPRIPLGCVGGWAPYMNPVVLFSGRLMSDRSGWSGRVSTHHSLYHSQATRLPQPWVHAFCVSAIPRACKAPVPPRHA